MAYQYYMAISAKATAVPSNRTNFSAALVLTSANLKTVANGGHIQNTDANGGASGSLTVPADFVVSPNSDGSSPYDFEIVDYDATTGYIELWIEISSLSSSSDTTIYLVYGDSGVTTSQENVAGTWGNNYLGVWHQEATLSDSTANNNDGTNQGSDDAAGQIGRARGFIAANTDYIELGTGPSINGGGNFTVEVWIKTTDTNRMFVVNQRATGAGRPSWLLEKTDTQKARFEHATTSGDLAAVGTTSLNTGAWFYIAGQRNASNKVEIFVNGSSEGSDTGTTGDQATNPVDIGRWRGNGLYFEGSIDEVRISNVARDADWLATSYNNQADPTPSSTFWSALGSEVSGVVPRSYGFIM